jgi:hypothetical protein
MLFVTSWHGHQFLCLVGLFVSYTMCFSNNVQYNILKLLMNFGNLVENLVET